MLTWNKYWSLKKMFEGPFLNKNKSEILNFCGLPILTYGSQAWAMTKKDEQKLQVTQNSIERSTMVIRSKDKVGVGRIKGLLKAVRRNKWNWSGHVARYRGNIWRSEITSWYKPNKYKKGKQRAHARIHIHTYIFLQTYAYTYKHMYICMYVNIHTLAYISTHLYICMHTYTRPHTPIHARMHA